MATIIFVHGTGTRVEGLTAVRQEIEKQLASYCSKSHKAVPNLTWCLWGEGFGSKLPTGASVPDYANRGGKSSTEPNIWDVLSYDSLFELRSLAQRSPTNLIDEVEFDRRFRSLPQSKIATLLAAANIDTHLFTSARDIVTSDTAYNDALRSAQSSAEMTNPLARATVASLQSLLPTGSPLRINPIIRDNLVASITEELGGESLAIPDWKALLFLGIAKSLGALTSIERNRGHITDVVGPAFMDIVRYQKNGDGIRSFIAKKIEESLAEPPVALSR